MSSEDIVINVDLLINEVEKRPFLWDPDSEDYRNKEKKRQGWMDICTQNFLPDTGEITDSVKRHIAGELQLKWRHVRDNFVRDIRSRPNKKRSYIHSKQLSFLRKVIKHRNSSSNRKFIRKSEDETENRPLIHRSIQQDNPKSDEISSKKKAMETSPMSTQVEQSITALPNNADMAFFTSLIPMLNELPSHLKLQFRIEVMQLLHTLITVGSSMDSSD